ncbi:hypothetical protein EIP91_011333 [Steccherinum ochraceum]|uniref:Uncharacterized protein n=1 Tax=Steccherinum ochraceum TaxID=92696 RepID=A0A4R0R2A8_9APHY|nr:hypothetical protein EIP91_011333 [Steccherinum ochraceum]
MRFAATLSAVIGLASTAAFAAPVAVTTHSVHARRGEPHFLAVRDTIEALNVGEPQLTRRGGGGHKTLPVRTKNPLPDPDKPIPSTEQPSRGSELVLPVRSKGGPPPPNTSKGGSPPPDSPQHAVEDGPARAESRLPSPGVPEGWPTNVKTGHSPPPREQTPWFPYKEGTPGAGV